MIFVDNEKTYDPRVNLAIEEYLVRKTSIADDILLFYINEPSVIIGRNQNTIEEVNRDYIETHGIHVVRRLSGGGAVYHDHGNLNYSFITRGGKEDAMNFEEFTAPVVRALNGMGVPAMLGGRNDILVDEKKISGNAIYITAGSVVCHGTLLLDADLTRLSQALNVKPEKIESKGIKSVRSRVANISEYLPEKVDIETFRMRLLAGIFEGTSEIHQYHLTEDDWEKIRALSAERYQSWEWNWGRSPAFNIQKVARFPCGEIDARVDVQNGVIRQVQFFGDFFGQEYVAELAEKLTGARYERTSLRDALANVDITRFFARMTPDEFLDFIS